MSLLHEVFKETADHLVNTFNSIGAEFILNSLDSEAHNDTEILSDIFCNKKGMFINTTSCDCDIAFFGLRCSHPGVEYWGDGWVSLQVLFACFYLVLAILTWHYMKKNLQKEFGFCKKIKRILSTPKYLVIVNLIIASNSIYYYYFNYTQARFVYIALDPFCQHNIFSRIADRILHELIFSSFASFYLVLLLVWIGLYTAFNMDITALGYQNTIQTGCKCCTVNYYSIKSIIVIVLIVIYPVQIIFSYFRGGRNVNSQELNYILWGLMTILLAMVFVFIFYTCKLWYVVTKDYLLPKHQKSTIIFKEMSEDEKRAKKKHQTENDLIDFVKEMGMNKMLDVVEIYILERKIFSTRDDVRKAISCEIQKDFDRLDDESDEALDYENELIMLDSPQERQGIYSALTKYTPGMKEEQIQIPIETSEELVAHIKKRTKKGDSAELSPIKEEDKCAPEKKPCDAEIDRKKALEKKQKALEKKKKDSLMTDQDIKVLNMIFGLSIFIIVITLIVIIIGLLLRATNILKNPNGTIAIIVLSCLFEVFCISAIFCLFVKDITSIEYQNLKMIGEIDSHLNKGKEVSRLHYKEFQEADVFDRFKSFIRV